MASLLPQMRITTARWQVDSSNPRKYLDRSIGIGIFGLPRQRRNKLRNTTKRRPIYPASRAASAPERPHCSIGIGIFGLPNQRRNKLRNTTTGQSIYPASPAAYTPELERLVDRCNCVDTVCTHHLGVCTHHPGFINFATEWSKASRHVPKAQHKQWTTTHAHV